MKEILFEKQRAFDEAQRLESQIEDLQNRLEERKRTFAQASEDAEIAMQDAAALEDESTAQLEADIDAVEEINAKVRANLDKKRAADEAAYLSEEYEDLTKDIEHGRRDVREARSCAGRSGKAICAARRRSLDASPRQARAC